MKQSLFILCVVGVMTPVFGQQSSIDPELYQTWYLYSISVDLGPTDYYYGEDVAQMTIAEDLSFYATDNCWELTGNFEEDVPFFGDFGLHTLSYETACVLGGGSGYVLELLYEFEDTMDCYLSTGGSQASLEMETYAGFIHAFRNEITLNTPENKLQNITIFPNPTADFLNVGNLSSPIDIASLYDMNGSLIQYYHTISTPINISEVPVGIYFLVIEQEGASTVKRILKGK